MTQLEANAWPLPLLMALAVAGCAGDKPDRSEPLPPPEASRAPPPAAEDPFRDAFTRLDANADGYVDNEELQASHAALDRDGDGRIDASESPTVVRHHDRDDDGQVTPAEMVAADWEATDADRDGDGRLSYSEYGETQLERKFRSAGEGDDTAFVPGEMGEDGLPYGF